MNGIIYTRVSSDEQVRGTSLEFQEQLCRKYCEESGIEVQEIFREEGASAKTTDRKELLRALEYCRKHKGKIQAFVVAKVDRFARNTEDHFYVRKLLLDHGITLHSVTEPIGNSPTEKFVETVLAASSEFDNAIRKQRCMDGMVAKIAQGLWPFAPPVGYKCARFKKRGEKKTEPDPPDEETFPIIQRALKAYAQGIVQSQAELAQRLDDWGLSRARGKKTTPQLVDRLLGKYLKFYAGVLVNPWTGEERRGLHKPMITEEELRQIHLIRIGKAKVTSRDRYNPLFPLRRTVLCGQCLRSVTGGLSRGNGGRYAYYHCASRDCDLYGKTLRKERLEDEFAEELERLAAKETFLQVFEESVRVAWQERRKNAKRDIDAYSKQLAELEARRERIFEMREDGSYTRETFQERLAELDRQIAQLIASSNRPIDEDPGIDDLNVALSRAAAVLRNPSQTWLDLPAKLKPRFQKEAFPVGISYQRDRGFGTAQIGLLFEMNRRFDGDKSQAVDLVRVSWNRLVECLTILGELCASNEVGDMRKAA